MQSFEYVAIGPGGEHVEGLLKAENEVELDRELEAKGLILRKARLAGKSTRRRKARMTREELINVTNQLSTMVGAGVPLVNSLQSIAPRLESESARALLEHMVDELRAGSSLSDAMEEFPGTFPDVFRSSVVAGEASGALDQVLARLAEHLKWVREIRSTTVQALIYPFCLFIGVVGLILILLLFVLPRIVGLFPGGVDTLPVQTRIVLAVSGFLQQYWPILLLAIAGAVAAVLTTRKAPAGKSAQDGFLLALPKLGPILRRIGTSKFANTAGILQKAGCDIFTVLNTAAASTGNARMQVEFGDVVDRVRRGSLLSDALEAQPSTDPLLIQLVGVGEKAGRLDDCLERLVEHMDEEIKREVKRFLTWLEPMLLFGAGIVVAFIMLATVLPIFQMYENLN